MRFNLRIKFGEFTVFGMIARTQTLEGVTSLQSDGKHIVMWDLKGCSLEEAEETLRNVQRTYILSNIYIVSDIEGSYRAWCFNHVNYNTLLSILVDSLSILDYNFFYYTVKRKKATLRTSNKKDRPKQKVVDVLYSYPYPIYFSKVEKVIYDTGTEKRGYSFLIGGHDG
jgi:hypothetical protein